MKAILSFRDNASQHKNHNRFFGEIQLTGTIVFGKGRYEQNGVNTPAFIPKGAKRESQISNLRFQVASSDRRSRVFSKKSRAFAGAKTRRSSIHCAVTAAYLPLALMAAWAAARRAMGTR
jgi:hypothetical protein